MSCDKFSDLWDGQVKQLEAYWPGHPPCAYIVTDKPSDRKFEKVQILAAGENLEWSERLAFALQHVETEYVFFTLDDYFLIDAVPEERIDRFIQLMDEKTYDYIRLFPRRKNQTEQAIPGYPGLRGLNPDSNYAINLYAGIWRKSFMQKAVQGAPKNAWQFEVSLRRSGVKNHAKCAVCMDKKAFPFLDVVRKGKLLRKANRYFKKHDVYQGSRAVNSFWYEFKLGVRTMGVRYAPQALVKAARAFMIKRGHHYFSQDAED